MTVGKVPPWEVLRLSGPAGELHARELPAPPLRQLWLCQVTRAALVLGSSPRQLEFVNQDLARRRGLDVVHRRSGGAAVLLEPGAQLWADLLIGRDDPLWHDDVGRAAWWVGAWWQRSLACLGITTTVHQGPLRGGELARRICFAGVGPGEVLAGGRKLVGLSQRRTRNVARLQTVMLIDWRPAALAELCNLSTPPSLSSVSAPFSPAMASGSDPSPGAAGDDVVALGGVAVGLGDLVASPPTGPTPGRHGRTGGAGASRDLLAALETALIEQLPGL